MSTRPNIAPQPVITNGSMATNLTSKPTILLNLSMLAYQAKWTGTSPVGTVSLQGSEDYALNPDGTVANAGTWTTLTVTYNGSSVTTVPVTGNTGSGIVEVTTSIFALRLIYTAGSGTGTLNVTMSSKVA